MVASQATNVKKVVAVGCSSLLRRRLQRAVEASEDVIKQLKQVKM
jgi:hypothetical protein